MNAHYSARNNVGPNTIYKSETVCRNFWSSGNCRYGDGCSFAHVSDNTWQTHAGTGNRNEINPSMPVCNYFSRGMKCPFDRCRFIHHKSQVPERKRGMDMPRDNSAISIHTRSRVDSSTNLYMKTKLCNKWSEYNSCPFGDNCCFAHGLAEIRTSNSFEPSEYTSLNKTSRTINKNAASHSGVQPIDAGQKVPPKPKSSPSNWSDNNKKLVGIYADWIDEDSFEPPPIQPS